MFPPCWECVHCAFGSLSDGAHILKEPTSNANSVVFVRVLFLHFKTKYCTTFNTALKTSPKIAKLRCNVNEEGVYSGKKLLDLNWIIFYWNMLEITAYFFLWLSSAEKCGQNQWELRTQAIFIIICIIFATESRQIEIDMSWAF